MVLQYGKFRPTNGWDRLASLGHPSKKFNQFRVFASLVRRRRSPEANRTLSDLWPSPGLVHYTFLGLLSPDWILPRAKFTLRQSLAFSCIGSVTARHFSSRPQLNFAAWYKEWNYGTFAEVATYIRLGGHHVGHRPTYCFKVPYGMLSCLSYNTVNSQRSAVCS